MYLKFKFLFILIFCILCTNINVFAQGVESQANIKMNNVDVYLDLKDMNADSLTYKNDIYLPLREISEALGFDVNFDKNTGVIFLTSNSNIISTNTSEKSAKQELNALLKVNSFKIYVDGKLINADNIVFNDTTYLPLSAFSDNVGVDVKYDSYFKAVYLSNLKTKIYDEISDSAGNAYVNSENYKPLLTKDDIDYPARPTTIDDFKKVMLYMSNNNLTQVEFTYYGTVQQLFYDNTELYDNLSIAFQDTSDEYVDLMSGVTEFNCTAVDKNGKVIVTITFSSSFYKNHNLITGQLSFEEEAKKINDSLIADGKINENMSERDIARVLYTYVITTLEYDTAAANNETEDKEAYTGYGAAINKIAVCQGYTSLYNYLLKLNGIECFGQSGEIIGEGAHIWTVAILDGNKSYIDVTFGDPIPDRPGHVNYKYFDIRKEELSKDRTGVE